MCARFQVLRAALPRKEVETSEIVGALRSCLTAAYRRLFDVITEEEEQERLKRNYVHVLISRQLNTLDYEAKVDIEFASDDELYANLQRLFACLFEDGPFPE